MGKEILMNYLCSVCNQKVSADLMVYKMHTENHIVDLVKHDHPNWIESNGLCQKCLKYYEEEIKGSTFKDADCALRQRKVKGFFFGITNFFKGQKS